jgi:hypothetical protein
MREDKRYRAYFLSSVAVERPVPNPWRSAPGRIGRAIGQGGWVEEIRPGRGSILGYALTGLGLVACVLIQAQGWRNEASRGAEWLLANGQISERVVNFISNLPSPY